VTCVDVGTQSTPLRLCACKSVSQGAATVLQRRLDCLAYNTDAIQLDSGLCMTGLDKCTVAQPGAGPRVSRLPKSHLIFSRNIYEISMSNLLKT